MDFFIRDSSIYTINIIRQAIIFNENKSDIIKGSIIKEILKRDLTGGYLSIVYYKSKFIICFSEGSKGNQGVISVMIRWRICDY